MSFDARCLVVALVWSCASSVLAQSGPVDTPAEQFVLPNGVTVLLQEDHRRPRVGVAVTSDVGFSDDPDGHAGLAHLTEHLMFSAWQLPGVGSFHEWLREVGATSYQGGTGPQTTAYYELVPREELQRMIWSEAHRFAYFLNYLNEHTLERERFVVAHEEHMRGHEEVCDLDYGYLDRFLRGRPMKSSSTGDGVASNELKDVQWFFQHWYRPDRLRVALVGDFDVAEARTWVTQYFGSIAVSGRAPVRARAQVAVGQRRVTVHSRSLRPRLFVAFALPSLRLRERAALMVLRDVLAWQLETAAFSEWGTVSVNDVSLSSKAGSGALAIGVRMRAGETLDGVEATIRERLSGLATIVPAESAVSKLRDQIVTALLQQQLEFHQRALALAVDSVDSRVMMDALRELSAADVRALAQRLIESKEQLQVDAVFDPYTRGCWASYD